MSNLSDLTGKQKAAILLISLGPDMSAQLFKHLSNEQIEEITLEIANVQKVDTKTKNQVLKEFYHLLKADDYITNGGIKYAREILDKALGPEEANNILNRLTANLQVRPFDNIRRADAEQIFNFIQGEHPQTIALILSYIETSQASLILSSLPEEIQTDVAKRIALIDRTSPEIIKDVEAVLDRKLSSVISNEYAQAGGIDSIVDILNQVDRGTEKNIFDHLDENDPDLSEEIKKKMFVFEDITLLSDKAVQMVLREVETHDVALALKTSGEEVENVIFSNMSQRAVEMLKEDIEYMGPVRIKEVEDAQQRIVNVIRRLEESGEIIIARGGESELIV